MAVAKKNVFEELNELNVNEHVEKKDTGKAVLSYLSWPWAWAEVKKRYPNASYEIVKNENYLPYFSDPKLGIMVYTAVTIEGVTHTMWLPVMDGANNAMKEEPYTLKTKFGEKTINAATMFDVNKTIMRCLVKNLAMFGLGLYIYAGEDLPEESEETKAARVEEEKQIAKLIEEIKGKINEITKDMTLEQKKAFNKDRIIPIVEIANYTKCTDKNKLERLRDSLSA